jgi:hypothetical protein
MAGVVAPAVLGVVWCAVVDASQPAKPATTAALASAISRLRGPNVVVIGYAPGFAEWIEFDWSEKDCGGRLNGFLEDSWKRRSGVHRSSFRQQWSDIGIGRWPGARYF